MWRIVEPKNIKSRQNKNFTFSLNIFILAGLPNSTYTNLGVLQARRRTMYIQDTQDNTVDIQLSDYVHK